MLMQRIDTNKKTSCLIHPFLKEVSESAPPAPKRLRRAGRTEDLFYNCTTRKTKANPNCCEQLLLPAPWCFGLKRSTFRGTLCMRRSDEMANMRDSKSRAARLVGSSPTSGIEQSEMTGGSMGCFRVGLEARLSIFWSPFRRTNRKSNGGTEHVMFKSHLRH